MFLILISLQSTRSSFTPPPPSPHQDSIIRKLNALVVVDFSEFIRKAVLKFLPAQSSYIWCKCRLQSNFFHSKIFQSDRIQRGYCKKKFTAHHACRNADSNLIHICIDFLYYNPGQNVLGHLRKIGTNTHFAKLTHILPLKKSWGCCYKGLFLLSPSPPST